MSKGLKVFCLVVLITILAIPATIIGLISYELYRENVNFQNYIRSEIIPKKIKTSEILTTDYTPDFGGGGNCGGVSFRLTPETIADLQNQGLQFLTDATPTNIEKYYGKINRWQPWKKKEKQQKTDDNARIPHGCVRNAESLLNSYNYKELYDEGYYTSVSHRGYSNLWLFPQYGIIVYNFYY